MLKKTSRLTIIVVLVVLIITSILVWDLIDTKKIFKREPSASDGMEQDEAAQAGYVGKEACFTCHQREFNLWLGSHHDLAMQVANDTTILANFNNTSFTHFGVTSKFYKREGKFYVETEGLDGKNHEYLVSYAFGVSPLQQYLVKFPDGRYQVLPICWDTRPASEGGQRWFHIYPDERIAPDDILFWMRMNQNWNFMCAECHSTNLRKNYDVENDSYNTTFSEINVACESCHGPGSEHVEWADNYNKSDKPLEKGDMGLKIRLKQADQGTWVFRDAEKGSAERNRPLESDVLVEMCARCHSRRTSITDEYVHGKNLLNTHRPRLIEEGLYFSDGQILEEVYVYDSFLQSKMHQKGVICTDCHEPHSTKVYAQDNTLCYRCHSYEKFGTRSHHFHNPDSSGASCVDCHMPERTYMVVDPRRDHSIRIPRPDLSEKLDTPNACNQCHKDKSNRWATDYVKKWYGNDFVDQSHFGTIFEASRNNEPGSRESLLNIATNQEQPVIVRASAILELQRFPDVQVARLLNESVKSPEPLIRFAAAQVADMIPIDDRWSMMKHLLSDSLYVIRLEAANRLSGVNKNRISNKYNNLLEQGIQDYIKSQYFNGERPSSRVNLGVLYTQQGEYNLAEAEYRSAINLEPGMPYPYINLADLFRIQNRDDLGEKILLEGIDYISNNASLFHALGLLYARQKKLNEALIYLKKAMETEPGQPNFGYTYAIALNSTGSSNEALEVLKKVHGEHQNDQTILQSLTTISRDNGLYGEAEIYARRLLRIDPHNQGYATLLREVSKKSTKLD